MNNPRFPFSLGIPCAAVLVAVAGLLVTGQQPPAFKSGVDLVEVDAVVDDGKGHPVRGLRQDEFSVREDGRPVVVESFAELDADGAAANSDARFVVLLLDDWTAVLNTTNVKRIAHRFVDQMGDRDSIAILRVDGDAVTSPMNRAQAAAAIEAFRAKGVGVTTGIERAQHILEMIGSVSRQMAPIAHRRKTLVFIGATGYIAAPPDRAPARLSGATAPVTANALSDWFGVGPMASRANVAVYAMDPDIKRRAFYNRDSSGFATETGGEIFVGSNVFNQAVDQIWSEAGHYYVLGYAAPAKSRGTSHRIDIRVARSGASVRARRTRAD